MTKTYRINEVFYSMQGEGMRAGTANVFVRFTGCNLRCDTAPGPKSPGGFACDTEFESGSSLDATELLAAIDSALAGAPRTWVIFTGGEPGLQVDEELCDMLHAAGFKLAIETNGTVSLPMKSHLRKLYGETLWNACGEDSMSAIKDGDIPMCNHPDGHPWDIQSVLDWFCIDWITVSPKVAEHAIKQVFAHEVKYVRGAGQAVPKTRVHALNKLVSPAFNGLSIDREAVATCARVVHENPDWRMSVQQHKQWSVR